MQNRLVGSACCAALAAAAFLGCNNNKAASDTTATGNAKSQKTSQTRAFVGGLKGLDEGLDDLLKDSASFVNFVASAEGSTPLQAASQSKIKVDKSTCSHAGKSLITSQTFATSGVYSYADLTIGSQSNGHAYLIARMQNDDDCAPIVIAVPPSKVAGQPGVAFVFVALKAGGDPNSATDYQVRVIDSTTRADVGGSGFTVQTCAADPKHQWFGDHAEAKKWADKCDHTVPKFATTKVVPADDIDDPWSLWFACASNCCYSDTGGIGGQGRGDTTRTDSTHGGPAKKAAPAKKGTSA